MIVCKLERILKRRKLKISTISRDTGISRTTLTALIKGHTNGVNFDTLSTLCEYLDVPLEALIVNESTVNGISVELFMRQLIDHSNYANNKVKIKTSDGKEYGVYVFSTLENGDVEIIIAE